MVHVSRILKWNRLLAIIIGVSLLSISSTAHAGLFKKKKGDKAGKEKKVKVIQPEEFVNSTLLTNEIFFTVAPLVLGQSNLSHLAEAQQQFKRIFFDQIQLGNNENRPWSIEDAKIYFPQYSQNLRMKLWDQNRQTERKHAEEMRSKGKKYTPTPDSLLDPNVDLVIVASRVGVVRAATALMNTAVYHTTEARDISDEAMEFAHRLMGAAVLGMAQQSDLRDQGTIKRLKGLGLSFHLIETLKTKPEDFSVADMVEVVNRCNQNAADAGNAAAANDFKKNFCPDLQTVAEDSLKEKRATEKKLDEKGHWVLETSGSFISSILATVGPVLNATGAMAEGLLGGLTLSKEIRQINHQKTYLSKLALREAKATAHAVGDLKEQLTGAEQGSFRVSYSGDNPEVAAEVDRAFSARRLRKFVVDSPERLSGLRESISEMKEWKWFIDLMDETLSDGDLSEMQELYIGAGKLLHGSEFSLRDDIRNIEDFHNLISSPGLFPDEYLEKVVKKIDAPDWRLLISAQTLGESKVSTAKLGPGLTVKIEHYGITAAKKILKAFK